MKYNYYEILGIPLDASSDAINKAYRAKALLIHPDRNPATNATAMFQELQNAYEHLSDPQKKLVYDKALCTFSNFTFRAAPTGFSPEPGAASSSTNSVASTRLKLEAPSITITEALLESIKTDLEKFLHNNAFSTTSVRSVHVRGTANDSLLLRFLGTSGNGYVRIAIHDSKDIAPVIRFLTDKYSTSAYEQYDPSSHGSHGAIHIAPDQFAQFMQQLSTEMAVYAKEDPNFLYRRSRPAGY